MEQRHNHGHGTSPTQSRRRLLAALDTPDTDRQLFNDTGADQLWLVVGAPREEITSTLEMSEEQLRFMYPEGPKALPPELGGGQAD